MGVHGLWKLIESSGKPVPLETLENKVLAVDISIWLHQAIKGFQDHKGAPVPNAHLLGIYHRVCKLLYFKIKPIFVFDGGVPVLKRQTIAKRNQNKAKNASEADRLQKQLISTLLKHTAISKVLSEKTKASLPLPKKTGKKYDDLYAPPLTEFDSTLSSSDEEEETSESTTTDSSPTKQWDLHTIDTASHYFKSLPLEIKHNILTDLKETRKQNSWGKLHQLPKQSDDFSSYQMKRLLKRQEVQSTLDEVSKEMGGMSLSLAELESLLKDQGIKTTNDSNVGKRILSDDKTRYLYISDIQEEIKKAKERENEKTELNLEEEEEELKKAIQLSLDEVPLTTTEVKENTKTNLEEVPSSSTDLKKKSRVDLEEEEDLRKAIQLSLGEDSFSEKYSDEDFLSDSDGSIEEKSVSNVKGPEKKFSSAQNYMLEYSGLTPAEIDKIIGENKEIPVIEKTCFKNSKLNELNINSIKEFRNLRNMESQSDNKKSLNQVENVTKKYQNVDKNREESIQNCKESLEGPAVEVNQDQNVVKNREESIQKSKESPLKVNEIEIMSVSEESDDDSLCSVKSSKSLEIRIDPNKINKDDLFHDIFHSENSDTVKIDQFMDQSMKLPLSERKYQLEIVIDPNKIDDDLFKDIFDQSTESASSKNITFQDSNKQQGIENKNDDSTNEHFTKMPVDEKIEDISTDKIQQESLSGTISKENGNNIEKKENLESKSEDIVPVVPTLTIKEMQELKENLQNEKIDLLKEKSTKERLANNITDQMYQEAQELLELFGVPYVVAPMEAEAQCAFLDEIELTNGTITDDSDVWLFGGRTVYKNFFNQSKYVMEFKSENIEHHFKLTRQQMILLALLVGSDYTTGLQGVGPVTALEILASFPPVSSHQIQEITLSNSQLLSGLREFKSWCLKGKTGGSGRSALKNKLKTVTFIDHFPNPQVVQAYLEPTVETSKDPFSWSKPDISGLTVFATDKFGWTMKKTEEILNPVIKKLEENQSQKAITDYFRTKFKIDSMQIEGKVSKRVKSAIDKIGKSPDELIAQEMVELEKSKQKAAGKKSTIKSDKPKRNKKNDQAKQKNEPLEDTPMESSLNNLKETSQESIKTEKPKSSVRNKRKNNDGTKQDGLSRLEGTQEQAVKIQRVEEKRTSIESRNKQKTSGVSKPKTSKKAKGPTKSTASENALDQLEKINELKDYENLAAELKLRRKRKNEMLKLKLEETVTKKPKVTEQTALPLESVPEELLDDEEIQLLAATTSNSNRLVKDIQTNVLKSLEETPKPKNVIPLKHLHTKDVIHQRVRDKSNLLRNKMKAIEVFRKSKRGPGYVEKRKKIVLAQKEDAELSECSD